MPHTELCARKPMPIAMPTPQAMTYFTKLSLIGGEVPLEAAYDWASARCIMDVGGGRGEMLSRCMAAAGPAARGVLMDRPWVLDR